MKKNGLIGKTLGHSLSPQIHQKFYDITQVSGEYKLFETQKSRLGKLLDNLERQGYIGLNVTIPYKTEVMQYLDEISDEAMAIGAVNTILFKDSKRYGYNTDYYGLKTLFAQNGIDIKKSRVVILGTGGSAKCALKLMQDEGASETIVTSRNPQNADEALYAVRYNALDALGSIDILINTTPVGMSPNIDACPVADSVIQKSTFVVDIIYNPQQTLLLKKAESYGKKGVNGLLMLSAQAIKAQEIWNSQEYADSVYKDVFLFLQNEFLQNTLRSKKTNIVLIGMPGSGKTSIGKRLADRLRMNFADTDALVEKQHGAIPKIFSEQGEPKFRDYEHEMAKTASELSNTVISTGGGVILNEKNMRVLGSTGIIVFLKRPLQRLLDDIDTEGRPLLPSKDALKSLFRQRDSLYHKYADYVADNTSDMDTCIADIINKLEEK